MAIEVWRGVDVVDVSATRSSLRAIAKHPVDMQEYLSDGKVLGRDPTMLMLVMRCAANGTRQLEVLDVHDRFFHHGGHYAAVRCIARILPRGHVALAAVVTTSLFEARWFNPEWEHISRDGCHFGVR